MRFFAPAVLVLLASSAFAEIPRRLPPPSDIVLSEAQATAALERIKEIEQIVPKHPLDADARVLLKAVQFAVENGEFWNKKEFALVDRTLDLAEKRARSLREGKAPWHEEAGRIVRGYRSSIDGSFQPYGLEIPDKLNLDNPVPLLVWLHGRGDKITDLHFIERCRTKSQAFQGKIPDQQKMIVVHPFGRQCIGFKSAGEIDVLEVIEEVKKHYPIDGRKVILGGFSMGGAGAWHIGAHYPGRFAVVHAGAGFAETARYNRLTPDKYPSEIEQTLWKIYDVPNYTRNLFNAYVLAYSGENDKQKQAADVMEEAFAAEGQALSHRIGPEMGHKYDDASAAALFEEMQAILEKQSTNKITEIQTPTARYGNANRIAITALGEHWKEARLTVEWGQMLKVKTENVTEFRLKNDGLSKIQINQEKPREVGQSTVFSLVDGKWKEGPLQGLQKRTGRQGPIDDAFLSPFTVIGASQKGWYGKTQTWAVSELDHFADRWRFLMRGTLPVSQKVDRESTRNLILFGDPDSNPTIASLLPHLPIEWTKEKLVVNGKTYDPRTHVPVMIYPRPGKEQGYVVLNSGLTFRENHDRTNSLQNPKLPDWAVIGLDIAPDGTAPGQIVDSGFFDEQWQFKK